MKKAPWISQIILSIGLLTLILFAFSLLGSVNRSFDNASTGSNGNPLKPSQAYRSAGDQERADEIKAYKTKIANENLRPDTNSVLKTRLAFAEKQATLFARTPNPNFIDVTETPDPINDRGGLEQPDGIIRGIPVPWRADIYTISNVWKGKNGKEKILIYAGALSKDKDQGIVIVRILKNSQDYFYPTPKKAGALSIISYDGTVVQLISKQGETFKFDVTKGIFLGYPDPTATPTLEPVVLPSAPTYPYP